LNQTPASVRRTLLEPLERFFRIEAASGIVLLCAAVAALLWANSGRHASYESLQRLHFLVNDGLMTVFFLLVGLEIRREMHAGALSSRRTAAVPVIAAAGGMIAPALIFLAVADASLRRGWAIPTATDIAFALGALTMLGKRVPTPARALLLALAVMDDIGAILIIAFLYTTGIDAIGLLIAAGGVAAVLALRQLGVRWVPIYLLPGLIVWFGLHQAGVHPTLAGVIMGLLLPAPAERLEEALHPWVAYGIMPLFALVNAGVSLHGVSLGGPLTVSIGLALVLGKPLGITLFTWLATRSGLADLAPGLNWRGVLLVGCLGGIGFTMSVFLATLAFADPEQLAAAKAAVLLGSAIAGSSGFILGKLLLR